MLVVFFLSPRSTFISVKSQVILAIHPFWAQFNEGIASVCTHAHIQTESQTDLFTAGSCVPFLTEDIKSIKICVYLNCKLAFHFLIIKISLIYACVVFRFMTVCISPLAIM